MQSFCKAAMPYSLKYNSNSIYVVSERILKYFQLCLLMQIFSVSLYGVCCCVHVVAALFLKKSLICTPNYHLDFPRGVLAEVPNALDKQKFVSLINVHNF